MEKKQISLSVFLCLPRWLSWSLSVWILFLSIWVDVFVCLFWVDDIWLSVSVPLLVFLWGREWIQWRNTASQFAPVPPISTIPSEPHLRVIYRETETYRDTHTHSERVIEIRRYTETATDIDSLLDNHTHRQRNTDTWITMKDRADVIFVLTNDVRGWRRVTKIEVFLTKKICAGQWGVVFHPCFSVPRSSRRGHWTEFGGQPQSVQVRTVGRGSKKC